MADSSRETTTSTGASESRLPGNGCLTLHSRPLESLTVMPRLTPVCFSSTSSYTSLGSGAFAAPQGPLYKSRLAMSVGSTHRLAPGGRGAFWTCGRPTPAHDAPNMTAARAIVTKRIIFSLRNKGNHRGSAFETAERERVGQAEQEPPAFVALRDIEARKGLAPGVKAQPRAVRPLVEIEILNPRRHVAGVGEHRAIDVGHHRDAQLGVGDHHVAVVETVVRKRAQGVRAAEARQHIERHRLVVVARRVHDPSVESEHDAFAGHRDEARHLALIAAVRERTS